jgi:multicomponent Na+:H+ antiporter subunit G
MNEIIALVLMGIGMVFNFFGCLGLIRFPDVYNRLQAGTKCVTLGTIFVLLGAAVFFGWTGGMSRTVLCLLFILITSPTAAHAIARGAHRAGVALWKKSVVDKYKDDKEGEKG